jgi:hypothetical protein
MIPLAMDKETITQYNESRKKIREIEGELNYHLERYGDHISEREGYRGIDGMAAIHFYLIHKFGWLPRDVKSMSLEDVRFVLSQEMEESTSQSSQNVIRDAMRKGFNEAMQKGFNDDLTEEVT